MTEDDFLNYVAALGMEEPSVCFSRWPPQERDASLMVRFHWRWRGVLWEDSLMIAHEQRASSVVPRQLSDVLADLAKRAERFAERESRRT